MSGCSALVAHAELAPCSFLSMPRFFAQRAIFGARAVAGVVRFGTTMSANSAEDYGVYRIEIVIKV